MTQQILHSVLGRRLGLGLVSTSRSSLVRHGLGFNQDQGGQYRSLSSSEERKRDLQWQGMLDSEGLVSFETLYELQKNACKVHEKNSIFGTYKKPEEGSNDDAKFEWMTYAEFAQIVDKTRSMLRDLGVETYSKVGIISNNRWEWAAIACASYSLNATIVPMYEAQLPGDWTYILNDSGCSALFCATKEIYNQVRKEVLPSTPLVKSTICLDGDAQEEYTFAAALERAKHNDDGVVVKPSVDDLADLIYTSGTTGKPKGVELTHDNIVSNVKSGVRSLVTDPNDFISPDDRSLAFLPWAHSYGQTCELWGGISQGGGLGICRGVPFILEDLQLVKPSILFAVPTLYKRIYDGVQNTMESSSPIKKALLKRALYMGRQNADVKHGLRGPLGMLERLQYNVLNKIVLSKIRDRFGGNLRHSFVAGAACPPDVIDFFDDLGITVCEGYGLTETSPIIAMNTPESRSVGSVGKTIGGVDVYIMQDGEQVPLGEEGEICCVGPNVMRSYYKNPDATDEVISLAPDGKSRMFHTGDLGRLGSDGFLRVTGRLKEQYKLENGKYVVPTPIEEAIGMSRFLNQVVLYGSNRPHNIALLVPDWPAVRTELEIKGDVEDAELVNDKRVKKLINAEIIGHCYKLKKFEVPTAWAIVAPFTAANNMLTPKMSIRRHKVVSTYKDLIESLYEKQEEEEEEEEVA